MLFVSLVEANLTTRLLGREIEYLPFTDSTNDDLWELHETREAAEGQVVVTDRQRAGRGRGGRPWFSGPDLGLPFSVLLNPEAPKQQWGLLALAMGVAVVDALSTVAGVQARLKWPNDIMHEGKKLGGILAETRAAGAGIAAVIGVGLNVNEQVTDFPEEFHASASSVRMICGAPVQRELLLAAILNQFETLYRGEPAAVVPLWLNRCAHLQKPVRFSLRDPLGPPGHGWIEGIFSGMNPLGQAEINVGGEIRVISAADVQLL